MGEIVWSGDDGLDKYRLVRLTVGNDENYFQLERSQQVDSLGVDIWHVYTEIPGFIAAMFLLEPTPEKLSGTKLPKRGNRVRG